MKRKEYQQPTIDIIRIEPYQMICNSKGTNSILNEELDYEEEGLSGDDA